MGRIRLLRWLLLRWLLLRWLLLRCGAIRSSALILSRRGAIGNAPLLRLSGKA
jgi:hypothetical protein